MSATGAGAGLGPAAAAMLVTPNDYSGVLPISMLAYLITAIAIVVAARFLRAH